MKTPIKTAAVAVAAVGISNAVTPVSLHVDQTAERTAGTAQASQPFGLSLEDLRVGLTGKVRADVGSADLPVRVADDTGCRVNRDCKK
jgi:hypothetical protein